MDLLASLLFMKPKGCSVQFVFSGQSVLVKTWDNGTLLTNTSFPITAETETRDFVKSMSRLGEILNEHEWGAVLALFRISRS